MQRAIDIVANNVANASTTGFKREGIVFDTLLSQPAPGESIDFVVDRATYRDASNGPINPTGNPLDLAIQGAGYFPIQTPQGTRYTRAGTFQLNTDGQIVTLSGDIVARRRRPADHDPDHSHGDQHFGRRFRNRQGR